MFKLYLSLFIFGVAATLNEAQSIISTFPSAPRNPFLSDHLRSTGFYDRNIFENNYQKNYFRNFFTPQVAGVISNNLDARHDGNYQYVYETENGIHGQERGIPRLSKSGEQTESVDGSYSYTSPEGLKVLVEYIADENGFRPKISYGGVGAEKFVNSLEPASVIIQRRN